MTDAPERTPINWRRLLAEGLAIIFSVLVALGVDEWRDARQDARRVERAKADIGAEVQFNRPQVARAVAYHDSLIKSLKEGRNMYQVGMIPRDLLPADLSNGRVLLAAIHRALEARGNVLGEGGTLRRIDDSTFAMRVGGERGRARIRREGLALFAEDGIALRTAFIRNVSWETAQATQAVQHMDYALVSEVSLLYQLQRNYLDAVRTTMDALFGGNFETGALYDLLSFERSLLVRYDKLEPLLGAGFAAAAQRADTT
ncbi:MAG: hypothetical protein H7066_05210 [Cytophagaceae bacterium]|nr:hypothetical protein [Gemmatimonadaceae bacterium]